LEKENPDISAGGVSVKTRTYTLMLYVTFNVSPDDTVLDPPVNAAAENKIPPVAAVSPTFVTPDPPVTTMFPVIVAEPVIEKDVVVADFEPEDAAVQPTLKRVLDVMIPDVISVTVGEA